MEPGSSEAWHITEAGIRGPEGKGDMLTSVCQDLKEGGMALIAVDSGRGAAALSALCDTLEVPLVSIAPSVSSTGEATNL